MTCPRSKALSSLAETRDDSPKVVSLADQFHTFSIPSDWNFICFSSSLKRLTLWQRPLERPLERRTSRDSDVIPRRGARNALRDWLVGSVSTRGQSRLPRSWYSCMGPTVVGKKPAIA